MRDARGGDARRRHGGASRAICRADAAARRRGDGGRPCCAWPPTPQRRAPTRRGAASTCCATGARRARFASCSRAGRGRRERPAAARPQRSTHDARPRVALVSDLREERWHSMDLVAELLLARARMPGLTAPWMPFRSVPADGAAAHAAAVVGQRAPAGHHRSDHQPLLGLPAMAARADRRLRSLPHRRSQLRASGRRRCPPAARS